MTRNNGFLRYWTFSNLPLFLLASPMMFVLSKSGWDVLRTPAAYVLGSQSSPSTGVSLTIRAAAFAQLLLAILTLLRHHVQVITRISSGYPIWYLWLATKIVQGDAAKGKAFVYFMAMYAAIQAVLFASFLPPA
jgi:GPI mannosyltransferase 2